MKSSAMEIKQQLSFLEFTSKTRQFGICLFLENAYFFLKATTLTQNPHIYGDGTPVQLVRLSYYFAWFNFLTSGGLRSLAG